MDDGNHIFEEISFWLIFGPSILLICFFGATLADFSGRFLVDVVSGGDRISGPANSSSAECRF